MLQFNFRFRQTHATHMLANMHTHRERRCCKLIIINKGEMRESAAVHVWERVSPFLRLINS